jgi:hypothetical protein
MVKYTSRGYEARRTIGLRTVAILKATAEKVKAGMKAKVGVPYPPASRPGRYPRKRTGKFQRSIKYRVRNQARVKGITMFSDDPKAAWLEYGTRHMAPRPTFRLAKRDFRLLFAKAFRRGKTIQ